MSNPPDPNNPYASGPYGPPPYGQTPPPYGQQAPPPYGYGQQPPPGMQPGMPPGYGYPQAPYPGAPWVPYEMPGQVVAARVMLFVAGSLWGLVAVAFIIAGLAVDDMADDLGANGTGGALIIALVGFVIFGGMSALHIVPATQFGHGGQGTRVTAIVAASVNTVLPALGFLGSMAQTYGTRTQNPALMMIWAATAIVTIVFCSNRQAGAWFNRPRH
ncbi:hypothetical protein DVA86_09995 [Streptomyces armeniacus]|uniref:Uncharacterized protein n=1 Tax=Streptomyces armeniacus TaxID=83291 RepID=A0A345XMR4_9ACTN|nr:hypothetical protein [Streptomyces armeniacus]AXK32930.1 hypothetical protein DVA86_09995 [Streptomyces armeniacus]